VRQINSASAQKLLSSRSTRVVQVEWGCLRPFQFFSW